jgi:hypothetical protein
MAARARKTAAHGRIRSYCEFATDRLGKMTPEERAELRKEVVKESKL